MYGKLDGAGRHGPAQSDTGRDVVGRDAMPHYGTA